MHVGHIITWERAARGREHEALAVFADALAFWDARIEASDIESREVFIHTDGRGMVIVTGDSATIQKITETDEYREIMNRCSLFVDGFTVRGSWSTGEEIDRLVVDYGKAVANL